MKIIEAKKEELEQKAANLILDSVNKLLETQDKVVLALPGGRSVSGIFEILSKAGVPWDKVHIFMIDERLVPIEDKESNFKLVRENLIDKINIPSENVHPFIMVETKDDYGLLTYQQQLEKLGGLYDIILLSSGKDGHVGALYPQHHSIKDDTEFFLTMTNSPKPPPQRMTSSRKLLLRAKVALVLFFGDEKKAAFEKFKNEQIDFYDCPARIAACIDDSYAFATE